jgi:hypothetical protein
VVEQKCEIEYNDYRYFTLTGPDQLKHHNKSAFAAFLSAASGDGEGPRDWNVGGKSVSVDGAILIWGAVPPEGRAAVIEETGLHDILGLDRIIADCAGWKPDAYCKLVSDRRRWCGECSTSSTASPWPCDSNATFSPYFPTVRPLGGPWS